MGKNKLLILFLIATTFSSLGVRAADITVANSGLWYESSTWPNGVLPTEGDNVIVPAGITLTMAGVCRAREIDVHGTLNAVNFQSEGAWIDLRAQSIMVTNGGLLEIGTETQPYIADVGPSGLRCQITLTGSRINNAPDRYKGIMVMPGGQLELHGKKKMSWTNLSATANAGSTQITLKEAVDWEVGDIIAITSTDLATQNGNQWENVDQLEIAAISADGTTITTTAPLQYKHIGGTTSYTRQTDGKTWEVNIQAEVGLLSHYIKIQGETSDADGFGGHIMLGKGSTTRSENIELFRMGQRGVLGRYPYHWHLNEDLAQGSYLRNSSIHKSFNRAVTIHGTDYVTVDGVFAYDHIGHGIFLESGAERFNTIKNNVVFVTRKPSSTDALTPSDNQFNAPQNRTPASYWITNANNIFENNVAAGTEGTGFWIAQPTSPMFEAGTLPYYSGLNPAAEPLGKFDGFVAHTCMNAWDFFDQLNPNHSLKLNFGWLLQNNAYFENGLMYGNEQAVYSGLGAGFSGQVDPSKVVFRNCVFTDNTRITMLAANVRFTDNLMNTDSGLGVFVGSREFHWFYDGPGIYEDCHFEGWDDPLHQMIRPHVGAGATENFNPIFRRITKGFSEPFRFSFLEVPDNAPVLRSRKLGNTFRDEDGSLLGAPGTLVRDVAFMRDGHEFRDPSWSNAIRSDYTFGSLWMVNASGQISVERSKPGTSTECFWERDTSAAAGTYKFPMIVNEDFLYTYYFSGQPDGGGGGGELHMIWNRADEGDLGVARFKNVGRLGNFRIAGAPQVASLAALNASNDAAWYQDGSGDVYLKMRSKSSAKGSDTERTNYFLRWDNNGSYSSPGLPCTFNVFEPGTSTNIPAPTVSFTQPTQTQFNVGDDLGVDVFATSGASNGENIANVQLSINGQFVRQEGVVPYLWGTLSGQTDAPLLNLAQGTYTLTAVATNNQGVSTTETMTITVGQPAPTTTVSFTQPTQTQFNVGDDLGVDVFASDGTANGENIANVQLSINGQFVRQEGVVPYLWGTLSGQTDAPLLNLAAGTYTLTAVATNNQGDTTTETLTITVDNPVNPNADDDGDGRTQAEEAAVCMSDNNSGDFSYDFTSTNQGFLDTNDISAYSITAAGEYLLRVDQLIDPYIVKEGLSLDGNQVPSIIIRGKSEVPNGSFKLYWTTVNSPNFSESKAVSTAIVGSNFQNLTFDLSNQSEWQNQTITKLRIDLPVDNSANFHTWIDYIRGSDFDSTACGSQSLKIQTGKITVTNEISSKNTIVVYPNPVKDWLNIDISDNTFKNAEIVIYNLSGSQVMTKSISDRKSTINVQALRSGTYILKIIGNDKIRTKKFVKN